MWIGIKKRAIEHTIDISDLCLAEGCMVLVCNRVTNINNLYERVLPDELYWATYNGTDSDVPHDIIHVTKKNGLCMIFFDTDVQERKVDILEPLLNYFF